MFGSQYLGWNFSIKCCQNSHSPQTNAFFIFAKTISWIIHESWPNIICCDSCDIYIYIDGYWPISRPYLLVLHQRCSTPRHVHCMQIAQHCTGSKVRFLQHCLKGMARKCTIFHKSTNWMPISNSYVVYFQRVFSDSSELKPPFLGDLSWCSHCKSSIFDVKTCHVGDFFGSIWNRGSPLRILCGNQKTYNRLEQPQIKKKNQFPITLSWIFFVSHTFLSLMIWWSWSLHDIIPSITNNIANIMIYPIIHFLEFF